jgi:hypothetical protein
MSKIKIVEDPHEKKNNPQYKNQQLNLLKLTQ